MIFYKRQVFEGERLPWGYGHAYYLVNQDASVCYLIPFNWIVRWARNFYFWLARPRPSYKERYEAADKQVTEYQRRHLELDCKYAVLLELWERQNYIRGQSGEPRKSE